MRIHHSKKLFKFLFVLFIVTPSIVGIFHPTETVEASAVTNHQRFSNLDYKSAGVGGLRNATSVGINLTGVSGTVTKAFLIWNSVSNGSVGNTTSQLVTIAHSGTAISQRVTGIQTGVSDGNCWDTYTAPIGPWFKSHSFMADVTGTVSGDGRYIISAFSNKGNLNPNGASLLVFFDDGNAANNNNYILTTGNDSNKVSAYDAEGWAISIPDVNAPDGNGTLELHVADGQTYPDPAVKINGSTLMAGGSIFQGRTVPGPNNGPIDNGNLWDIRSWSISPMLDIATQPVNLTHGYDDTGGDCVSFVAGVITLATIPPVPAPTVTLSANPTSVPSGSASTLTWSSTNSNSCTATALPTNSNWNGVKAINGNQSSGPLTVTTDFLMNCAGPGGVSPVASAVVTVPVTGTCSVAPTSADTGQNVTWTSTATGGTGIYTYSWSGTDLLSGVSSSVVKSYTAAGTKTGSVTVTSGTASTTIVCDNFVIVTAPPSFDYGLQNSGTITVTQGLSGSNTITLTLITGMAQPVTLTVSGLPAGATAVFDNNPCTPNPSCVSSLTITTLASTPSGSYPIVVSGNSPTKTTTFTLIVNTATQNGSVKGMLVDGLLGAMPGTTWNIDGGVAQNHGSTIVVLSGSHTINATKLSGFTVGVGSCLFAPAECFVNTDVQYSTTNLGLDCAGAACSANITVPPNNTIKVAFKYVGAPGNLIVNATPAPCNGAINLSWNSVGGATSYNVYRSLSGIPMSFTKINSTPVIVTSYTDTGLTLGMTYYYAVSTVDGSIESPLSSVVSGVATGACSTTGSVKSIRVDQTFNVLPSAANLNNTLWMLDGGAVYGPSSSVNPELRSGVPSGTRIISVSDLAGYTEEISVCNYPSSGPECFMTNPSTYSSVGVTCATGFCSASIPVAVDAVTKVAFRYVRIVVPTGSIRTVRVDENFSTLPSALNPNTTSWGIDGTVISTVNPETRTNISLGNHTIFVTDLPGYTEQWNTCDYAEGATECRMTDVSQYQTAGLTCSQGFCSVNEPVAANRVRKVAFRYVRDVGPILGQVLNARLDNNLALMMPFGRTSWGLDGIPTSAANPAHDTDISIGGHSANVTNLPNFVERVGSSTYPVGGVECPITSYSTTGVTCTTTVCSANVVVLGNTVTKVFFTYGVPSPPEGVTVDPGATCGSVVVRWDPVPDSTGYNVYRSTNGINFALRAGTIAAPYLESGLTAGVMYYYRITAVNDAGESDPSVTRSITIASCGCLNPPANALVCAGDDQNLVGNTSSMLVGTCSVPPEAQKCEYTCAPGFVDQGGVCTVIRPLDSLTCSVTPPYPYTHTTHVTWTVNPLPLGSYTYLWSGSVSAVTSINSTTTIYYRSGTKTERVTVFADPAQMYQIGDVQCPNLNVTLHPGYGEG